MVKVNQQQFKALQNACGRLEARPIIDAIHNAITSQNVLKLAEEADVDRTTLYKSFGAERTPKMTTVLTVLRALDLKLEVRPKAE